MAMRIRTVKPEFFRHEELIEAEQESGLPLRLAYIGLWCAADREGRFRWKPRHLKLDIMPFDGTDFARVLDALWSRGFLVKYRAGEEEYGSIPTFHKHQSINNRESQSTLPDPADHQCETVIFDASGTREARDTNTHKGKGREGKGRGRERELSCGPSAPHGSDLVFLDQQKELRDQPVDLDTRESETAFQGACRETWNAYRDAYEARYGVGTAPPRNAKVNTQVQTLVKHLGRTEAPQIARWYVERCADRFAVVRRHEIGLLVTQWQSLRTQWITGRAATMTEAVQVEQTAARLNAMDGATRILEESGFYDDLKQAP